MTGLEDIVTDAEARTLAVRGPATAIRSADTFLRIFDNQQNDAQDIRIFRLEHISAREATTLVRMQLQVTELMASPERHRIAVRDTPERLDRVAALLASSDVSRK
jgi:type II secretory pathway component GspD/PulD (secretin)